MKKLIFLFTLAICVFVDLFFAGLIFYANIFHNGKITLDFNYFQEGWAEFTIFTIAGVVGAIGLIQLFGKWLQERIDFVTKNRIMIVIILCTFSFLVATAALVITLLFLRG